MWSLEILLDKVQQISITGTTSPLSGNATVGGTLGTGLITASGGIALGGTGAVNTLDDYEEGTWTIVNRSIIYNNH